MNELDANVALGAATGPTGQAEAGSGLRVFTGTLRRTRRGRATAFTSEPPPPPREPVRRPAKVARLLAMAHKLQRLIDEGKVKDRAELARQLGVSRARITQVLDLTLLAPDIQEEILFMEAVDGVEPLSERQLRYTLSREAWAEQRQAAPVAASPLAPKPSSALAYRTKHRGDTVIEATHHGSDILNPVSSRLTASPSTRYAPLQR